MANDGDDDPAWSGRYFTGGAPPQSFHVLIPDNLQPILTERLCLRPLKPEDAQGIFEVQSDPEHLKVPGSRGLEGITLEHTKAWIEGKTFTEPPLAAGRNFAFVIICRDDPTEKIIGTTSINRVAPVPNIGYGFSSDMWGKGYGTETLKALVDAWWALPREEVKQEDSEGVEVREKVYAGCNVQNIGSFRVLQKCGFQVYAEHVYADGEHVCVAVLEKPDDTAAIKN